ncbi:hypothetical protein PAP_04140 [Palaeococcus pacificus DY20341]|uniref:Glycosyl hydrolase family 4 C-terminal domain-containing protein n=1 Tax=Palaeococcus pacificus DY20341 TaxID=1343739 RepID=A0A075LXF6_9EURY|nr:hypothetical protein [Palaeococcus pacificus]AIF69243.1 hypothetical protein PAP_04140 [Palaeococcus pacificus DY20341]
MRIAFIGAGSIFTPLALYTVANSDVLADAEIYLIDVDGERLKFIEAVGRKIGRIFKKELKIQAFTDVKNLQNVGIDYAVISVEKERYKRWHLDFEIPHKYGIKQVLGENGGIGGLSHTLRVVPLVLSIAEVIGDINKDAYTFIYSNPEPRVTYAVNNYAKLKNVYGLCTGYLERKESLATLLNVKENEITFTAAGLNHFTWLKELSVKGKDGYPILDEVLKKSPSFEPLSQLLYKIYGLLPSPSDNHIGEYLPFAWELVPEEKKGLKWIERTRKEGEEVRKLLRLFLKGLVPKLAFNKFIKNPDVAMSIVEGLEGKEKLQEAINVPNDGHINGLPKSTIVEVPAKTSPKGVKPLRVELPREIIALLRTQAEIQKLSAEAAGEGSIEKVAKAVLLDPVVNNAENGLRAMAELMKVHLDMLPQFDERDIEEIERIIKS